MFPFDFPFKIKLPLKSVGPLEGTSTSVYFKKNHMSFFYQRGAQHSRRRIITFEFGRHIDTYFCNLEGHGSLNPLKLKLKNSGFQRNCYTGCPIKNLRNETENMTIGSVMINTKIDFSI